MIPATLVDSGQVGFFCRGVGGARPDEFTEPDEVLKLRCRSTNGVNIQPDLATLLVINRLVIENLQRVFAQPIPPGSGISARPSRTSVIETAMVSTM